MAWELRVPQFLHGHADEDEEEGHADDPGDDEDGDGVGPALEVGEVEDAVVEEEDAELGPDQVECVEDLCDDQELGDQDDVIRMESIRM